MLKYICIVHGIDCSRRQEMVYLLVSGAGKSGLRFFKGPVKIKFFSHIYFYCNGIIEGAYYNYSKCIRPKNN